MPPCFLNGTDSTSWNILSFDDASDALPLGVRDSLAGLFSASPKILVLIKGMTLVCPRPERPAILRRVREAHSRLELSHLSEAGSQRPRAGEGRLWPFAEGESCTRLVALMACRASLCSPVDFLNLTVSLSLGGARACKRRPVHRRAADMSGLAHLRKTPTHRTSRSRAAGDMALLVPVGWRFR